MFWGISNGMLGGSVVSQGNALVFHNAEILASTFIHLSPLALVWCMRWYADRMQKKFPGVFDFLPTQEAEEIEFSHVFMPTLYFYLYWWAFHSVWLIIFGRHYGNPQHEQDTIYMNNARNNNKAWCSVLGYTNGEPANIAPIIKYLILHAIGAMIPVCMAYPLLFNYYVHSAFVVSLLCYAAWLGSVRYYKMMTKYYSSTVERKL